MLLVKSFAVRLTLCHCVTLLCYAPDVEQIKKMMMMMKSRIFRYLLLINSNCLFFIYKLVSWLLLATKLLFTLKVFK